jgi:hypothetical protein
MLVLLRAPRAYAGTSVTADAAAAVDLAAALSADAASKPPLAAANSYDLTATAAAARVPAESAAAAVEATAVSGAAAAHAAATGAAAGLHSYPCQGLGGNLATTSSHSASSAGACDGPAQHSIMQDGQFGCAGDRAGSAGGRANSGGGVYRGPGGGMQPQLGLMALPGRKDSFSCNRGAAAHPASDAGSPLAGGADQGAGVKGECLCCSTSTVCEDADKQHHRGHMRQAVLLQLCLLSSMHSSDAALFSCTCCHPTITVVQVAAQGPTRCQCG